MSLLKTLIHRPIGVTMTLIAVATVTLVSLRFIPVSLMPDIDVPQITVHVSWPGASVREVDSRLLRPLKNQLMQVNLLTDIRSEARSDAGSIYMDFEPGSDIGLIYIEVNEKVDRVVQMLPEGVDRPRVVKSSATDIPAFYLDLSLRDTLDHRIAQLGIFARDIVMKRIEQLPQTAMVDVSGVVGQEYLLLPDWSKMESMGMTAEDLETVIRRNNVTLGMLNVADGICHYNIHFDSSLLTAEDIANIHFMHDGRIFRFSEVCRIVEQSAARKGVVRHDGREAITLAVIKQHDAQMKDLQREVGKVIGQLEREHPEIRFDLTRDQTRLLNYSINNLKGNLLLGALMACLILFLFISNVRLPLLVSLTIPLSSLLTLLGFHLLGITINIISLSGLILGVGMMVDNSIIVIDNIAQKWRPGIRLADAILLAVGEVFSPMLCSVLTTCSVFIPLIFLSGTAGALFYDQAMAVTLALFSSLLVSVMVIPVYFHLIFKDKPGLLPSHIFGYERRPLSLLKPYEISLRWVFRHPVAMGVGMVSCFLLACPLMRSIRKSAMPDIEYNDALLTLDWNAGISVEENDLRCQSLLAAVSPWLETTTSMTGVQDFLLSHTRETTTSESIIYLKASSPQTMALAQDAVREWMRNNYPLAIADFSVAGNLFELIFASHRPALTICLQQTDGNGPAVGAAKSFCQRLSEAFPHINVPPLALEENLHYRVDVEKLAYYGLDYGQLYNRLSQLLSSRDMYYIGKGSYRLPVTLGNGRITRQELLQQTIRNKEGLNIPLTYLITEQKGEDFKKLHSGKSGDYCPISLQASDKEVRDVMAWVADDAKKHGLSANFTGEYFTSRKLVRELLLVLLVAIGLLYFILATQFESLLQPLIILMEIVVDVFFVLLMLRLMGQSLNLMSLIGLVVMSGIVINDSILKVDTINRMRRGGTSLLKAIFEGGRCRLNPIVMTSLTTILAIVPFLYHADMGSALQYPLSLTLIVGMAVGTLASLLLVPLLYYWLYRKHKQ